MFTRKQKMKSKYSILKNEDFSITLKEYLKRKTYPLFNAGYYKKIGKNSAIFKPMRIIGKSCISIGDNVTIYDGLRMEAIQNWGGQRFNPNIRIGNNTAIQQNCHITCANNVTIGNGVSIMPLVLITDIEHQYKIGRSLGETGIESGKVEVEDYVTIGMGAKILGHKGVHIGSNAIIGANAVITGDIPSRAIAVGIPAHIIGFID